LGFTLVELLVVIGIIALLLSILIPTLGGVRKNAQAIKCAAALREINTALHLYARDYDGYYPVAKFTLTSGQNYEVNDVRYTGTENKENPYWTDFLARYATNNKRTPNDSDTGEPTDLGNSIFWGCPNFEGYVDIPSRLQTGYGMTIYPTHRPDYPGSVTSSGGPFGPPTSSTPAQPTPSNERNFIEFWSPGKQASSGAVGSISSGNTQYYAGAFIKQSVFKKQGSLRGIVGDSRFWAMQSDRLTTTSIPAMPLFNNAWPSMAGLTYVDLYRHGRYPPPGTGFFQKTGGKVGFNMLFGDGHVSTSNDPSDAYRWIRMKFPG
jgi:prepilin-type N-terminal cleavage/methylation domain-containing protein/prepilin-type processing-associated H-X9-DG protein